MATDKRQFTMRMQPTVFDKIRVISAINKRSMAMQIEFLLEQFIADYETSHGQIPLSDENQPGIIQKNSGGTNFIAMGGRNNYSTVAQ